MCGKIKKLITVARAQAGEGKTTENEVKSRANPNKPWSAMERHVATVWMSLKTHVNPAASMMGQRDQSDQPRGWGTGGGDLTNG
jgi:hypothetical protein